MAGPQREDARAFAAQCAAALALALRQLHQTQVQQQLVEAMASRSIIDQAIGILMGQHRCTAAVGFDLLRPASQHHNRKLRAIAADIIANTSGQPAEPRPGFRVTPQISERGASDSPGDAPTDPPVRP